VKRIFFLFLFVFIIACAPAQPIPKEAQATALAYVQTVIVHTQTAQPTKISLPTGTPTFVPVTPSPFPTQPPVIVITPDAIQVERWREYQTELAMSLLPKEIPEKVLCEWSILGQTNLEVYVTAVCLGNGRAFAPAVLYLDADGFVQNVKAVKPGSSFSLNVQQLFPPNVQTMINSEGISIIYEQLSRHLDWRLIHTEEPPLIILNTVPTLSP
jgi:hypothetical protein